MSILHKKYKYANSTKFPQFFLAYPLPLIRQAYTNTAHFTVEFG